MILISEVCQTSNVLKIIYFVKEVIKVVCIILPIGLIAILTFDFMKNVIAKEDEMIKNLKISIRRIIYCIVVFLIPTIVNLSLSILNRSGISISINECMANANVETIKALEEQEAYLEDDEIYIPRTIDNKDAKGKIIPSDGKTTPSGDNASGDDNDYSSVSGDGPQKILEIAEKKYNVIENDGHWTHDFKCGNNKCTTCCKYVSDVLKTAGYQKSGYICHMGHTSKPTGLDKLYKDKVSIQYKQNIDKLQPGDVVVYSNPNSTGGNVAIFAKKSDGKYYFYGASSTSEIRKKNHPSSQMNSYWKGKSGRLTIIRAK